MIVESFLAELGLQITGLEKLADFVDKIKNAESSFVKIATPIAAATVGFVGFTTHAAEQVAGLADVSEALGVSVQSLQAYGFAAANAGVSQGELNQSLNFLNRNLASAADGAKEPAAAFAKLGISAKELKGLQIEEAFPKIADGFMKIDNPAKRTQLAMELFGRSGAKLIPMLAEGAESLEAFKKKAQDLGIITDPATVKMFKALDDSLAVLSLTFTGTTRRIAAALGPLVQQLVNLFQGFLESDNWKSIISTISAFGRTLVGAFTLATRASLGLVDALVALVKKMGEANPIFMTLALSVGALALAFAAPSVAILVLVGLLAVLAEDLNAFFAGQDSAIGRLVESWGRFKIALLEFSDEADSTFLKVLGRIAFALTQLPELAGNAAQALAAVLSGDFDAWDRSIRNLKNTAGETIAGLAFGQKGFEKAQMENRYDGFGVPAGIANPNLNQAYVMPQDGTIPDTLRRYDVRQENTIIVQPSPGMDENDLANMVDQKIRAHHDDLLDQTRSQLGTE